MKINKLSLTEALSLPVGTVLVEASTYNRKEDNQVHCIVTEEGIKYFQYTWYKNKFDYDPASYGIGIPIKTYNNTEFVKLNIPPVDISQNSKQKLKMK